MTKLVWPMLCAAFVLGQHAEAAEKNDSSQGSTWASIAKLPDWSGVWALDLEGHTYAGVESGPRGTIERVDPDYAKRLSPEAQQRIRNANKNLPFTPSLVQRWSNPGFNKENLSKCLPAGVPGVLLHTIQFEFLFTPGRVTMLTENGEVRRIYTDSSKHLTLAEIGRTYEGESIGHWEGNTLVVDTIGFPYGELFQNGGIRGTRNTHYVERISLKDKDHLQIVGTLTDPELFTKPYTVTRIYDRWNNRMPEPQCAQTSHDDGSDIDLTPPPED